MELRRLGVIAAATVAAALLVLPEYAARKDTLPTEPSSSAVAARPLPPGVELLVTDGKESLPSRVHLTNVANEPVLPAAFPSFGDHFAFPGQSRIELEPGKYRYEIERGPEYTRAVGELEFPRDDRTVVEVRLERLVNLAERGWYSGDLHVHRAASEAEPLMRAEDLHVGGFVTWWNDQAPPVSKGLRETVRRFDGDRFVDPSVGEDERQGGALLFLRLRDALALPPLFYENGEIVHRAGADADEYPSPAEIARAARAQGDVHIALEKPFWWDAPTWVALGLVDSVGIAHNHMDRAEVRNHEAWGRPCDRVRYGEGPFANAYCTQDIYYRFLDAGFRLAPAAGSASGVLPNPVGYDRVYVKTGTPLDLDAWWRLLAKGRSFVTNGPLLLVEANGNPPGSILRATGEEKLEVTLHVELSSVDPILAVELVRDGAVVAKAEYDEKTREAHFPPFSFRRSGWFLVRALTNRTDTFRFASSAPFYVELGRVPQRISRVAVKFFRDWTDERIAAIAKSPLAPEKAKIVLGFHREARRVWDGLLARANAE